MAADQTKEAKYRQHRGVMAIAVSAIAITFSIYHILYILPYIHGPVARAGLPIDKPMHLAIHLGLILALVYLLVPAGAKASRKKLPWYDVVLGLLGVGWNLYILVNYDAVYARTMTGYLAFYENIGSWIHLLIVLEATRRLMGWIIPSIAAFFILYTLTANYFPGFLEASAYSWSRVSCYVGLFPTGLYGSILNISSTIIVSFILFGQFLFITGAGEWFINIAQALLGHVRGGPAKVAVVASSLMGTISGSGMANVATTGVFTIPLMKRTGYRAHFAGAVEAAASNGGQIMPPVMGIAAFIMIDFLQIPYNQIVLAGLLPAVAYFVALFLMVDFEAVKTGLRGIPRSELPNLKKTLMGGWQFIIPLAILIFLLMVWGYSPELSALYATAVLIVIGFFTKGNRMTLNKIYLALKNTAVAMLMMAIVCAVAGIIVSCVQLTGLSYRLSMGLVGLAAGNVWLLLLLAAVSCIILGMGMTTSAVYIIMAILVAPALIDVGFVPIAAHFYVFYFGVAALITPPVCPTSYIGAGIAGSSPMRTGLTAARLAIVCFVAPLIFIFQPALLMEGTVTAILIALATTLLATAALAGGLAGYMFGNLNILFRIILLASAALIVYYPVEPTLIGTIELTTFIGSVIIVAFLCFKFILSRLSPRPRADAGEPV